MNLPETCPACSADFKGEPIPERDQPWFGGAKFFSQVVSIYDRNQDRTTAWLCPFCNHEWPRAR
mgnify:CR=1 FL=1